MVLQPIRKKSLKERNAQRKKRRRSIEFKSWEIGEFCDFDVALFIYNREAGEHYVYISEDSELWPPTMEQIVSVPPQLQCIY
jgi:hypothetical protein